MKTCWTALLCFAVLALLSNETWICHCHLLLDVVMNVCLRPGIHRKGYHPKWSRLMLTLHVYKDIISFSSCASLEESLLLAASVSQRLRVTCTQTQKRVIHGRRPSPWWYGSATCDRRVWSSQSQAGPSCCYCRSPCGTRSQIQGRWHIPETSPQHCHKSRAFGTFLKHHHNIITKPGHMAHGTCLTHTMALSKTRAAGKFLKHHNTWHHITKAG